MSVRINSSIKLTLIAALAILIVSILILSWVPPVSKDALIHHLALPKLYLQKGDIHEIPSMPFSYYPMNLDVLYLIPLYFGNDITPKLIHFSFALLTAFLIFRYFKSRLNTNYALFGAVFFLSIPIVVKLSITVYVDLGLMFFSTASLLLLLKWVDNEFQLRHLIYSAILCGLAIGTKYNGLIGLFLLTLFVPFLYSRYSQKKRSSFIRPAGYAMLFFMVALLVFSPWMMRNYRWQNNPIYPLYNNWFNPRVPSQETLTPEEGQRKEGLGLFGYRAIVYNETWWQIALLPVRVFFEGKDGSRQYFDGKLNPFLLILPIFVFFRIKRDQSKSRHEKTIMLAFVVLFFAFAFFGNVLRIRYISPIIPPLIILSVFGLKRIIDVARKFHSTINRRWGLVVVVLMVILCLGINARYIAGQFEHVDPLRYIKGELTRDQYISKFRPEYPAMKYANKNLPLNAKCLFIFLGKRGYYFDREYVPDTTYQVNKLHKLVKDSDTPRDVLAGLTKMGISHLIIHIDFFEKWINDLFEGEKQKLLNDFFRNHVDLLYEENGIGVFRLIRDS